MAKDGRRRRWYTFSIRSLLVIVGLVAVWLGWWFGSAREQAAAVEAIRIFDTGANILYDDDQLASELDMTTGSETFGGDADSSWLEQRLGRDYFHNVVTAAFGEGPPDAGYPRRDDILHEVARLRGLNQLDLYFPVRDADVAKLSGLSRLKHVEIGADCPGLTDTSLRSLGRLWKLEQLAIQSASITDAGLAHLRTMPRLKRLALGKARPFTSAGGGVPITGTGLGQLAHLPALTDLEIHSEKLSGEGLRQLGTIRSLKRLRLKGGAFRDADLRYLAGLGDLESLEIVGTKIDGTGFEHLTGLTRLTDICLEGPNVTDAAIPFLAQLPRLKSLMIYGTRVTAEGLTPLSAAPGLRQIGLVPAVTGDTKRLKQALPNCNVLNAGKGL